MYSNEIINHWSNQDTIFLTDLNRVMNESPQANYSINWICEEMSNVKISFTDNPTTFDINVDRRV